MPQSIVLSTACMTATHILLLVPQRFKEKYQGWGCVFIIFKREGEGGRRGGGGEEDVEVGAECTFFVF